MPSTRLAPCLVLPLALLWSGLARGEEVAQAGCCTFAAEARIEYDFNRYYSDLADLGGGEDSLSDVRRAEVGISGGIGKRVKWSAGYDFKADAWTDAYLKYAVGNHGTLTAGQFKQPLGMEELSSTRTGDFISKAAVTNMLALARHIGVAYDFSTEHTGTTASVFGRTLTWEGNATAPDSGYALRGYWTPVRDTGQVVHLGVSHADFSTYGDQARLRARPNADLTAVRLVDTGTLHEVDRQSTTGTEFMWLSKGMKLEAEYMQSTVRRSGGQRDFTGQGAYVSGVWNLTGEAWAYRNGVPVTPKAKQPRRGLWQAGLRHDWIDLDDGNAVPSSVVGAPGTVDGVLGGTMHLWTAGVSVYWLSHVKLMLNYVSARSDRHDPVAGKQVSDDPQILEARVQLYW